MSADMNIIACSSVLLTSSCVNNNNKKKKSKYICTSKILINHKILKSLKHITGESLWGMI